MPHAHSSELSASTADESPPHEVEERTLNYPPNSNTVLVAGFSVLYESEDRPHSVCKVPFPWPNYERALEIEKRVFKCLGAHPNVVKMVGTDEHGIWLERAAYGCLRLFNMEGREAMPQERLQWCEDVARVLDYVHGKGRILLCDFGGSAIDGEGATICGEAGYRRPSKDEYTGPTIRCEIHSLGSTMYEIITGKEPHHGLEKEAVEKLLEQRQYPDVSDVPLGDVIQRCWEGAFVSAALAAEEIARRRVAVEDAQPL
ncbi:tyrosine-protein kinase transforming protein erbB [Achaetomium macrosporum]|uniref:Tyrosine-protein kinase transforming protein erbB n=1 Tax=Achaetomium macrosporum TaxID=79813 RepID=A0AAN7HFV9_9PEZI|nr:tyrosine-protein kinase transforming protein erbB [Achaetomium macrosporum]